MNQRIPIVLFAAVLLMTLGLGRDAHATVPNCSAAQCHNDCVTTCRDLGPQWSCYNSVFQCPPAECGTVPGNCHVTCKSSDGDYTGRDVAYNCPSGPPCGGSPIFRKQETRPTSAKKGEKQDACPAPSAKPDPQPAPARKQMLCP